ncbi:B12-binding domain-containing radical SAM protein [Petrotoga olearia]|uniref:Radical SAM protein n=2 Tax=Petrotoga olearia TaxID=156203 RepID=A0A2K1NY87_9BACT|nr:radical SAM protein [Petrotoga olearia]PNR95503.1 radical SAM protein [Petrotoga olearia DSM 13574]RMA71393.1 radical SAM superfamily enzyme YgiQ (UPF0313 family) [Petrotoga olearia]
MNFLVVNPWIYDFAAYDFWLKPLGLLYISEVLTYLGHNVTFVDLLDRHDKDLIAKSPPKDKKYGTGKFYNESVEKPAILKNIPRKFKRYGLPLKLFESKLETINKQNKIDAILVGITLTYWYYGGEKTIEILRNIFPSTPIFLGGVYSTLYTEHAENNFSKFKVNIFPGTGIFPLKKVLELLNEELTKLNNFNWFEEIDLTYDFYDSYLTYVVLISSVGCPFHCTYCVTPKMWKFQYRSIDKIINNIEYILKKRPYVKDVVFFDDAFLLRKDIKELLKALSTFNVRYHLPNGIHARRIDDEIALLLKKANFRTIKLGYESYDFNIQKGTGFKVTNEDLVKAVTSLKNAGFDMNDVYAYVLVNLPFQDKENVIQAVDFCHSLGIRVNLNEFTPIPGTVEYNELIKKNVISPNIDPLLLNNTIIPYWSNFGLSIEDLEEVKRYTKSKYSD